MIRYLSGLTRRGHRDARDEKRPRQPRDHERPLPGRSAASDAGVLGRHVHGLLLIYGLNRWLPEIMHGARYSGGKFAELCAAPRSGNHPRIFLAGGSPTAEEFAGQPPAAS